MNTNLRPLFRVLLASALLLAATPGRAESVAMLENDAAGGGSASATVRIKLVVLPMLRLLENQHASWSENPISNKLVSRQKMVVVSNLRQGFCVALRQTGSPGQRWALKALQTDGAQLVPTSDGYKLCGNRPGRYNLLVEHELEPSPNPNNIGNGNGNNGNAHPLQLASAQAWPIETELTTL